jgi:hypothetical protein
MNAGAVWPQIGLAVLLSISGAAGHALLLPLLGPADAARLLLLGLGSGYLLALLLGSGRSAGQLLFGAGWLVLAAGLLAFDPPLSLWLLGMLLSIWLLRCLLRHPRPLAALLDATLCGAAALAALATLQSNHSLWLALWVFFLLQALHVFIPAPGRADAAPAEQRFDAARRAAEAALLRMAEPRRQS